MSNITDIFILDLMGIEYRIEDKDDYKTIVYMDIPEKVDIEKTGMHMEGNDIAVFAKNILIDGIKSNMQKQYPEMFTEVNDKDDTSSLIIDGVKFYSKTIKGKKWTDKDFDEKMEDLKQQFEKIKEYTNEYKEI